MIGIQRENRKSTSYVYKGVSEIQLKTANINQDEYAGFRNRGPRNCCLINKQFQTHGFTDENFLGCSKVCEPMEIDEKRSDMSIVYWALI